MIGPALCVLLLHPPGPDPRKTMEQVYGQYNAALSRNDSKAMVAWCDKYVAPEFRYTSKQGNSFDRKQFIQGVREQAAIVVKPLASKLRLNKITAQSKRVKVVVFTDYEALVKFDTTTLKLTDRSTTEDRWTQTAKGWRIVRSLQTASETQMTNP